MALSESVRIIGRSVAPAIRIISRDEDSSTPIPASGVLTESLMNRLESDFRVGLTESLPPQTLSRPPERMPITRIEHKAWANAQRTAMTTVWTEEVAPHDAIMATLRHKKLLDIVVKPDPKPTGVIERIKRGFRAYQNHPFWTR